ncbi:MAG: glycosyltransferase family 2 protein [Candidatus Omnitrophica bacterium]|nr:glycosyltransferase family 2 protein [Candidatus Omnitrophota bacterium]
MENSIEIVIPAYNEEDSIAGVIGEIRGVLGSGVAVTVVDDASSDQTARIAQDNGARVLRHPYNIGNGASIKTALRNSTSDIIVFMDADGQHAVKDIPLLLKEIDRFDMIVGARSRQSLFSLRGIANRIYNSFASYVTGFKIEDLTSGFRAVKRKAALKFAYLLPNGFSYPSTITLAFLKAGRPIKYVAVSNNIRLKGKSKIRLLKDGVRFLVIITKIAIFFSPLRVFVPVSLVFFISGLLYYLYTYIIFHRFTNMAVFLFSNSVLIFLMGLVSEQINQLRMEKTEADGL